MCVECNFLGLFNKFCDPTSDFSINTYGNGDVSYRLCSVRTCPIYVTNTPYHPVIGLTLL